MKIELRTISEEVVTALLNHSDPTPIRSGLPEEAVLSELAAVVSHAGAAKRSGPGATPFNSSTKALFFRSAKAGAIFATATAIHSGHGVDVWRTRLSDGDAQGADDIFAEFTHTFRFSDGRQDASVEGQMAALEFREARPDQPAQGGARNGGTTDDQALIRHRNIYDGAVRVMSQKGFAGATMRDIAAAAGVPIATIYKHIKTKEDVLFIVASGCMNELCEKTRHAMAEASTAEGRIKKAVESYLSYLEKNRSCINLLYREMPYLSKANKKRIFELDRKYIALWEEAIVGGQRRGEFRTTDASLAANMICFLCAVWSLRYWSIRAIPVTEVQRYLENFILGGLRK